MPSKTYTPICDCFENPSVRISTPQCPYCGSDAGFAGFRLSGFEAMAAFHLATGVPPLAQDRDPERSKDILDRVVTCPACDGHKLVQNLADETWSWCGLCNGLGRAVDGKFSELPRMPGPGEGPLIIGRRGIVEPPP